MEVYLTLAPPRLSQTGSCHLLSLFLLSGSLLQSSRAPTGAEPLLGQGWSCTTGYGQAWVWGWEAPDAWEQETGVRVPEGLWSST